MDKSYSFQEILNLKDPNKKINSLLSQNIFPLIWTRNFKAISAAQQKKLFQSTVFVIGCGGLGGYVIELLARIGIGQLIFADGDKFEESNLNRQLGAALDNLGENKALEMEKRIKQIAPFCQTTALDFFLNKDNIIPYLERSNILIDCVGGIEIKSQLISLAKKYKKPLVIGAIAGLEGFVSSILPSSKTPLSFFQGQTKKSAENILGSPPTTVSLIATLQTQETIYYLTAKKLTLVNKILYLSLKTGFEFYNFEL